MASFGRPVARALDVRVDISAGAAWSDEITRSLDACNFGIVCITPENVAKPWVMFEAGALAKRFETAKVVPYIFGSEKSVLAGNPLQRFQAKKANKPETLSLIQNINSATAKPIDEARLSQAFEKFWPDLEARFKEVPAEEETPHAAKSPTPGEVLEVVYDDLQVVLSKLDAIHRVVTAPTYPTSDDNFRGLRGLGLAALGEGLGGGGGLAAIVGASAFERLREREGTMTDLIPDPAHPSKKK